MTKIYVFFISDGTGITAESFGQSLLAQFENLEFIRITRPYVNTAEKARQLCKELTTLYKQKTPKILVFSTIVNVEIANILHEAPVHSYDIFDTFIPSLENLLHSHALHKIGKKRDITHSSQYDRRIQAMNFALNNDDGSHVRGYPQAELILTGVSRCGKTPTCLYLGLQFGIYAANYPVTEEDIEHEAKLPASLIPWKKKLFGLTIDFERLSAIRQERYPNSHYASMRQCKLETEQAEQLFSRHKIPVIDTTHYSIEEIATRILNMSGIERKIK